MKKELSWSLVIFGVIILAFFGIHFLFLTQEGFDRNNYLTAFSILFPGVMIVGYIFLSGLFESRHRQEEELEHLVREVLHEINLPLSTIEANTNMILKKSDDERLKRRVKRIEAASKRLARLYRELSYNIKRQIAPVERERFDLAEVVAERAGFFQEMGRNPVTVELESSSIVADRIGLEQILDNLLENAMKYSDKEAPILIRLQGGELSIRDFGIGMDENEILRIYERYYQSDRNVKGEGIGLALVKRYCDDEGIGLRIRSTPGEGTEVSLDFSEKVTG